MNTRTPEEKAKNAIQWIDTLPNYKQAPKGLRCELGNARDGYCCLGAGAHQLGILTPESGDYVYLLFKEKVGLLSSLGFFRDIKDSPKLEYYKSSDLAGLNDDTNAGFKRIAKLLKTHPDWMFEAKVAELITEHYDNG